MRGLASDKNLLAEAVARERAFWEKARAIIDRLRKFIALHLDEHELAHTSTLARQALASLATFAKVEDAIVLGEKLGHAHTLIQEVVKDSKLLDVALAEAIEKPSPKTLERLDKTLALFERVEDEKLKELEQEAEFILKKAA